VLNVGEIARPRQLACIFVQYTVGLRLPKQPFTLRIIAKKTIATNIDNTSLLWFVLFAVLCTGSIAMAMAFDKVVLLALPFGGLFAYLLLVDIDRAFFLTMASIPLSIQWDFPNGFSTDLPTEPLVVLLALVFVFQVLRRPEVLPPHFFKNPIVLLLLLHLGWVAVATLASQQFATSLKYLLAKTWYIIVFFFMLTSVLRTKQAGRRLLWFMLLPLAGVFAFAIFKHAQLGFSFAKVNDAMSPFFHNHVDYACIGAVFLPYIGLLLLEQTRWRPKWWLMVGIASVLATGIYFSYTRIVYISVAIMPILYFIIKKQWLRYCLLLAVVATMLGAMYILAQGRYMEYAPNYEKTIAYRDFDDLLAATAKGEDLSSMERVYRWVAAKGMVKEHSFIGFGPSNFYTFYKSHTLHAFRTYVSDNPEKSGIHNYFLMVLVEQGVVGLLIFLLLHLFALYWGERNYHRLSDPYERRMLMAALLSLLAISTILLLNDMVESIKVGPFYFMGLALLAKNPIGH
jgi:O-antigen ligase